MEVIKIGGSLLNNIQELEKAACIIAKCYYQASVMPAIVISAFKNHTDELIELTKKFNNKPSSFVITSGEQITAGLLAMALEKYGMKAIPIAGWQLPILIHQDTIEINEQKIIAMINKGIIPVITGFQGVNKNYDICDLGRGGSDLTAVIVANAINGTCTLMKESGGIRSADPTLIKDCFVWNELGYDNLLQLANSGSSVLQNEAIVFAKQNKVPIKISSLKCMSMTKITKNNKKFWSIFSYKQKLRVVSFKQNKILPEMGFVYENVYYECDTLLDIKKYAKEVYAICKEYYK